MKHNNFTLVLIAAILVITGATTVFVINKQFMSVKKDQTKKTMYHCPMHPTIISDKPGTCPICGMDLVPIDKEIEKYDSTVQHPTDENHYDSSVIAIDPSTVQNMGVTTTLVENRSLKKMIRTSATLENNETGVSIITTKVMGYVEKLYVDFTGESVNKGQPLLTIYSPDLVNTQEEYLQALRYSNNLSGSSEIASKGGQELLESAKRRLLNWDMTERQIEELAQRGTSQRTITIYAPTHGIVMEKMVFTGQKIEPGMSLYKIADISKIWTMANIYQEDLSYVKVGMDAEVSISSIPDKLFKGKVQFISPILDEASKTAKVRIELPNTPDYQLKPMMFASVNIISPVAFHSIAIPEQAVLHSGTRSLVIIALGNGHFKPQEIKTGAIAEGYVQILDGLEEGQEIVTSSQFLIDSESNLKAAVNNLMSKSPKQNNSSDPMQNSPKGSNDSSNVLSKSTQNKDVYQCPMDKEIISNKPGKCPKCGMMLVKVG